MKCKDCGKRFLRSKKVWKIVEKGSDKKAFLERRCPYCNRLLQRKAISVEEAMTKYREIKENIKDMTKKMLEDFRKHLERFWEMWP